ncbi:MAG: AAA family ATPase, partial [Actinobacteria bacterium]|nr:AAA family ATPase [Actinomycetota bacterium]NIS31934.1 AAA family ATPase [Actinomycetota bacterium]NIU67027.1 AAA family ATPase [Actinomycetota bacterium]NIV87595.1 AAA family ATPase [Actinomycetota bacterium]NIW28817.1 AAA family ATPase [Actinomycetota bacterium]
TAAPGTVQITAETKRLVERLFEFEDIGGVDVKGVDEPVPAFRVVRALERPDDIRGIEGLSAPLTGRSDEFEAVKDGVECVATTGRGRIVSVMAEAGLGKSRLVREVRASVAGPDAPEWHEGRSLSYETAVPFAPVRRILQSLAGLKGDQSPAEAWRHVEEFCARVVPGRVADTAPFLAW